MPMMEFIFLLIIISPFAYTYYRDKRTLWLGFWFLLSGSLAGFFSILLSNSLGIAFLLVPLVLLGVLFILILILAPLISLFALFYSGIMVIKREGLTISNLLALLTGCALVAYMLGWPLIVHVIPIQIPPILNIFYQMAGIGVAYLSILIGIFTVTNILNFIHFVTPDYRYIVVLGAGLMGDQVTPLLASRINRGIELWRRHPDKTSLIMSGGQGRDELVSEGEAMAAYAMQQGVPQEAIIVENQSRNTEENLRYSYQLMNPDQAQFVIVTNYYHLLRALILARQQGLDCQGYGAKTKLYYSINAFLREFIGYLRISWRQHFIVILLLVLARGGIYLSTGF